MKYEYKTVTLESNIISDDEIEYLNTFGKDAWELVTVITLVRSGVIVYYFKRELHGI